MEKVIKVTPVKLVTQQTPVQEEKKVIEIDTDVITLQNIPPAIDIEPDVIDLIIKTPCELVDDLITKSGIITNYEQFMCAIRDILVRFDTDPKLYKKEDYLKLILAIIACFKHLYNQDISAWSVTEWRDNPDDDKVPTEKLVKETLDAIDSKLIWISNDPEKEKDVCFVNVVDDFDYYTSAKELYPNAEIFYLDALRWIIYANGLEYNFSEFLEFSDAKCRISVLEESIKTVLQKDNIDIDHKDNGVYLTFPDGGLLQVKLDLATATQNGALSSTDKIKIDSLDWVTF